MNKLLNTLIVLLLLTLLVLPFAPAMAQEAPPTDTPAEVVETPTEPGGFSFGEFALGLFTGLLTGAISVGGLAHIILTSPVLLKAAEGAANNVPPQFAERALEAANSLRVTADLVEEVFDGDEAESETLKTGKGTGVIKAVG